MLPPWPSWKAKSRSSFALRAASQWPGHDCAAGQKEHPGSCSSQGRSPGAGLRAVQAMVWLLARPRPPLPLALGACGCCGGPGWLPGFALTWPSLLRGSWWLPRPWPGHSSMCLGVLPPAPLSAPLHFVEGETTFIFLPPRLWRGFCSKWTNTHPSTKHCHSSEGLRAFLAAPALAGYHSPAATGLTAWGWTPRAHCHSPRCWAPQCGGAVGPSGGVVGARAAQEHR